MTNETDAQLNFLPVITAIEGASLDELAAITRVEEAISGSQDKLSVEQIKVFNPLVNAITNHDSAADDGDFTPVVNVSVPESNGELSSEATTYNTSTTVNHATAHAQPVGRPDFEPASAAVSENQDSDKGIKLQQETNQLLNGLYEDSQGRLRQENGAFATRKQKEALDQAKNEPSGSEDNSPLKSVASWLLKATDKGDDSGVVDSAGVAVGNSFWIAAKEVKDSIGEAKELIAGKGLDTAEGRQEKFEQLSEVIKNPLSLLGGQAETPAPQEEPGTAKATAEDPAPLINTVNRPPEEAGAREVSQSETNTLLNTITTSLDDQSETVERESIATEKAEINNVSATGEGFYQLREGTEAQTDTLANYHQQQLDALDDLALTAGGAAAAGSGLGLDDFVDFDGKKKKRGKRTRRKGKLPGGLKMPSALTTMTEGGASLFTKAGGTAAKLGGNMMRGAAKAVPFLAPALAVFDAVQGWNDTEGQKDAFGLKDGQEATTGQKSAMSAANLLDMGGLVSGGAGLLGSVLGGMGFEGAQQALTFDTGSMAKGIYSLFGGDSKSEESKDKADPSSDKQASAEAKDKEASESGPQPIKDITDANYEDAYIDDAIETSAVETDKTRAGKRKRSEIRRQKNAAVVSEINALAEENGISYEEAYRLRTDDKAKQEQERASVARDLGLDISGKVSVGDEELVSPKKKADQLAYIDAEIARRTAEKKATAEAIKNGTYSNQKFIAPEVSSVLDHINQQARGEKPQNTNSAISTPFRSQAMTVASTVDDKEDAQDAVTASAGASTPAKAYVAEESRVQDNRTLLAPDKPQNSKDASKPQSVVARVDPKLTRALEKLATQQPASTQTTQTKEIIKSENKAPTTQIPSSFNDRELKLIAMDIN